MTLSMLDKLQDAQKTIISIKGEFSRSMVWKAICDHITNAKVNECKICVKKHKLAYVRGHGPISLTNIYGRPAGSDNILRIDFNVRFCGNDDETSYCQSVMLDIPEDLVNNYSVDKFESFLNDRCSFVKNTYIHELELVEQKYKSLKAIVERF